MGDAAEECANESPPKRIFLDVTGRRHRPLPETRRARCPRPMDTRRAEGALDTATLLAAGFRDTEGTVFFLFFSRRLCTSPPSLLPVRAKERSGFPFKGNTRKAVLLSHQRRLRPNW